jgi:flagellin
MARINSNVPSLIAQSNLGRTQGSLNDTLARLSTGLRITRGADDPAGLIVSERLRSELRGIEQGIKNSERASNVIATTEGALTEVSDLLNSIKALVVEAANTGAFSSDEVAANQLQVDSAIESITRISNTASFAGLKLLNGSLGYNLSGVDDSELVKTQIFGAAFGAREDVQVDVEVLGSAQTANLYLRGDFATTVGGTAVDGQLPSSVTLEVAGPDGVLELTFVSGTTNTQIIQAINDRSSVTGVRANSAPTADVTPSIVFSSEAYGSDAFVSVKTLSGGDALEFGKIDNNAPPPPTFTGTPNIVPADRDEGQDVTVLVNGAVATGRGLEVFLRTPELDVEFLLDENFAQTIDGNPSTFHITGGGSLYQLGPQVTANQQVNVGIASIAATRLGGTYNTLPDGSRELQFLSSLKAGGINELLNGNLANASAVLETAIAEVATLRGRLGSFERNVLQTNIRSLQAGVENITASESVIRDADFAQETAELSRLQVLQQAGTSVLATANTSSQNVLSLLG